MISVTLSRCADNMLTKHEMMGILSAIYNRLYDQDFKDETTFPVSEHQNDLLEES